MKITFQVEQRKPGWYFAAYEGDKLIATMEALVYGEGCLIHNRVFVWSKSLYREYWLYFQKVREVLRGEGIRFLFTGSGDCDRKLRRYWEMMGFNRFGELTRDGKPVLYAIMEV